jgi:hypothetical protein
MIMPEFQVNCINKSSTERFHEYITHIGNTVNKWRLTKAEAIRRIDANEGAFYTVDSTTGKRAYVGVYREVGKAPYLRTHADGSWNNNLLAQAECDSSCSIIA